MIFKDTLFLYTIAILCSLLVFLQALFLLIKAKRELYIYNIDANQTKKIIVSSIFLSLIPGVSILPVLIILVRKFGVAASWIRLNFTGSIQDNLIIVESILDTIREPMDSSNLTVAQYITAFWIWTISSIMFIAAYPITIKVLEKYREKKAEKNKVLYRILFENLYLGLVAAFVASGLYGKGEDGDIVDGAGPLSLLALLSSFIVSFFMQNIIVKRKKYYRLQPYITSIAMIFSIVILFLFSEFCSEKIVLYEWRK